MSEISQYMECCPVVHKRRGGKKAIKMKKKAASSSFSFLVSLPPPENIWYVSRAPCPMHAVQRRVGKDSREKWIERRGWKSTLRIDMERPKKTATKKQEQYEKCKTMVQTLAGDRTAVLFIPARSKLRYKQMNRLEKNRKLISHQPVVGFSSCTP